jgi:hypothetical protein
MLLFLAIQMILQSAIASGYVDMFYEFTWSKKLAFNPQITCQRMNILLTRSTR